MLTLASQINQNDVLTGASIALDIDTSTYVITPPLRCGTTYKIKLNEGMVSSGFNKGFDYTDAYIKLVVNNTGGITATIEQWQVKLQIHNLEHTTLS